MRAQLQARVSPPAAEAEGRSADRPADRPQHAGCGWSTAAEPRAAVAEAAGKARRMLGDKKASYVFVAPTVHYDVASIRDEVVRQFGPQVRIHGTTSSIGVMTAEGLHRGSAGAVGLLAVADDAQVRCGVSGVRLKDFAALEEAGAEAVRRAVADAGMPAESRPNIVLISGTILRGDEARVMAGIAQVVGEETPVLGGNAGDEVQDGKWRQFTRDDVFTDGVVLTALYASGKVGWTLETGFRPTDKEGVVTRSDGKTVYEIDGRPALDVYDQWLDGKFYDLVRKQGLGEAPLLTSLNPLSKEVRGRQGQVHYLISRIVPDEASISGKCLNLHVPIEQGSRIRLLSGNWQTMLNRCERGPEQAMIRGGIRPQEAAFGIVFFCKLAAKTIPASELPKLPLLTANAFEGVPFLGVITIGEQGPMPGFQNVNAHLAESIVIVGQPAPQP
jgi:hypothetical protein